MLEEYSAMGERVSSYMVLDAVCDAFGVSFHEVCDPAQKTQVLVAARCGALVLMREYSDRSLERLAVTIGYRDKKCGYRLHRDGVARMEEDEKFRAAIEMARTSISERLENGARYLHELAMDLYRLENIRKRIEHKLELQLKALGADVGNGGFPVKLGGFPFALRQVTALREHAITGVVECRMWAVDADNRDALLLDGRCGGNGSARFEPVVIE